MTIDCTREEAEILIAALTFAEAATVHPMTENPGMAEALKALAPRRTALIRTYLQSFFMTAAK